MNIEELKNKSIPNNKNPIYKRNLKLKDEEFVEIKPGNGIFIEMMYSKLNLDSAIEKVYLRKTVAEMLYKARKILPKEYGLKIWDAWRPLQLQEDLYYKYKEDIIKEFHLENCPKEEAENKIAKYVSLPVADKEMAPLHATGGAIDVTLTDEFGNNLDLGVEFDEFTYRTNTIYYENDSEKNKEIVKNRRILYHIMTSVGFTNLPSECWHYDYGNKAWAYFTNRPIIYDGKFTENELNFLIENKLQFL